jgi:hypothetical protein
MSWRERAGAGRIFIVTAATVERLLNYALPSSRRKRERYRLKGNREADAKTSCPWNHPPSWALLNDRSSGHEPTWVSSSPDDSGTEEKYIDRPPNHLADVVVCHGVRGLAHKAGASFRLPATP